MSPFVDFSVMSQSNLTLIMPSLRGTQIWQKKPLKDKLQVTHSKSIWFCWELNCRKYILNEHFEKLNWLSTNQRFKQGVTHTVFKCPAYMNKIFMPTENTRTNTRNSCLKAYFSKTNTVQNGLSYIGHAEFQKFWGRRKTWILVNIRWNTTIWMISLTQIYEVLVNSIMSWLS